MLIQEEWLNVATNLLLTYYFWLLSCLKIIIVDSKLLIIIATFSLHKDISYYYNMFED